MSRRELRVGLNLVYLVPGETGGMETYARELIPRLVAARPDASFIAFVNREAAEAGGGPWGELIPAVTVPVRARNRIEWVRGEQQYLPRLAAGERLDLLHSLANTAPVWGRTPRILTVHDLIYHRFPEAHPRLIALGMRTLVPLAAHRSRLVIADSEATRRDLVELTRLDRRRIDVVPLGLGAPVSTTPAPQAELRTRLELEDRPVVLSVSAKRPHKNLSRLLDAFAKIVAARAQGAGALPVLVIPGSPTPHERELRMQAEALGLSSHVRFPGWASAEELEALYGLADIFVFPSLYEGFGLPVLEAMHRGIPVACSDRSSLPEVVGDAAILFNPEDPVAIAHAMRRLLHDSDERERLRSQGIERARQFSWEKTAAGTLRAYERATADFS